MPFRLAQRKILLCVLTHRHCQPTFPIISVRTSLLEVKCCVTMLKNKFFSCILLAFSHATFAAQLPVGGNQMQQIPAPPPDQKLPAPIEVEGHNTPVIADKDTAKMTVNNLKITGAQVYSEANLLAITGFKPGRKLTLADLRNIANRIADYYHHNGYFVAQAYIPAQDILNGTVTLSVIEGKYGGIILHNKTKLSNSLAQSLLGNLNKGDLIASAPLENSLLLLSDLPGLRVQSTLTPGASIGVSDLIVDLTPAQRFSGSMDADNAGNLYTGTDRLGVTVNLNEPCGYGDIATLRLLTSGPGLSYARAAYQFQLAQVKIGLAYSNLQYSVGQEFANLQANGTAHITSLFSSYPLIRSRQNNLNAKIALDAKFFEDRVGLFSSITDKSTHVLTAAIEGDLRDTFAGGGLSSYSLSWLAGKMDIKTPSVLATDAATAQSNGDYNKLVFNISRLQSATGSTSFYAGINGQSASKNLDVSEKMELGGITAVRAYPEGESYADHGYVLNLESRTQISGRIQLIGFLDTGTVSIDKNPWSSGTNRRTLSGAGAGFNWAGSNNFWVKGYYAHKVGDAVATSAPDSSGRFWIQAVKYF